MSGPASRRWKYDCSTSSRLHGATAARSGCLIGAAPVILAIFVQGHCQRPIVITMVVYLSNVDEPLVVVCILGNFSQIVASSSFGVNTR